MAAKTSHCPFNFLLQMKDECYQISNNILYIINVHVKKYYHQIIIKIIHSNRTVAMQYIQGYVCSHLHTHTHIIYTHLLYHILDTLNSFSSSGT